jgi:hypothetical protein
MQVGKIDKKRASMKIYDGPALLNEFLTPVNTYRITITTNIQNNLNDSTNGNTTK